MKQVFEDTIAAIATPVGIGGVGVIRISGPESKQIFRQLFSSQTKARIESHRMTFGWISDPKTMARTDQIMACFMRAPRSYTGEDTAEFFCHGGAANLGRILKLTIMAGARLAERGEFTKRAYLNGKFDLARAEAILDLISAKTEVGAGFSARQLEGKLSAIVKALRANLLTLQAGLEAQIDFAEDLPKWSRNRFARNVKAELKTINDLLITASAGKVYREGLSTVIIGKPNVGKSSLLNALLGEERAIVTEAPGTTRDTIEEVINLQGLPLKIIDTAGIRHPKDKAEEFGVKRTENELAEAGLALIVLDASKRLGRLDKMVLKMVREQKAVVVLNKIDLARGAIKAQVAREPQFQISAITGAGIKQLKAGILKYIQTEFMLPRSNALLINARHQQCLTRAGEALVRVANGVKDRAEIEILTIELKAAIIALGEITGEEVSEEVVNAIFDQFCVGK